MTFVVLVLDRARDEALFRTPWTIERRLSLPRGESVNQRINATRSPTKMAPRLMPMPPAGVRMFWLATVGARGGSGGDGGVEGGGEGGGGEGGSKLRGPQSAQSVPSSQLLPSELRPPSWQTPLSEYWQVLTHSCGGMEGGGAEGTGE